MKPEEMSMFSVGEPNDAYAKYFVGQSYLNMLSTEQVVVGNVTFGQMLLVTAGEGWYQEWGQKPVKLHPGSVVHIPTGVKHWHGATANSWFQHLAIEVPGENCSNEWCEPVSDDAYTKLEEEV